MLSRRAFTLLELILSLALLAVGTVALMGILHRGQMGIAGGENVLIATQLAKRRLEELRNVAYGSLASESEARVSSPSGFTRFCRQVDVTTPDTNLRQIVVTVSWDPPDCTTSSSNPNVSLQTYRSAS